MSLSNLLIIYLSIQQSIHLSIYLGAFSIQANCNFDGIGEGDAIGSLLLVQEPGQNLM